MRERKSLKRSSAFRSAKRKFIIFSEGERTEPEYLLEMTKRYPGALVELEVIGAAGVPTAIAKLASSRLSDMNRRGKQSSSFQENDQVWAVFDRDDHLCIDQAIKQCEVNGVGIAFSNPCFEVWLMLHYEDFDKPEGRHTVQKRLAKLCHGYDRKKGKSGDLKVLMERIEIAEDRAEKQIRNRQQEGSPIRPPFTTVFRLTRQIRLAHNSHSPKSVNDLL